MLYYDRISVSEGIDANKTGSDVSKLCNLCYFYFFKKQNCNYELYVFDRCHGLSQRATDLNEIKIVFVKNNYYGILSNISHKESIQLLERSDLTEKFRNF